MPRQAVFTHNLARLIDHAATLGYALALITAGPYRATFTVYAQGTRLASGAAYDTLGAYWVSLHVRNGWGGSRQDRTDYNTFTMI